MNQLSRYREIIATYRKHGWELRRVLLSKLTRLEFASDAVEEFGGAAICEAEMDALWFDRPSQQSREAWELRLVAESPYALFETFAKDEPEERREETRSAMEARMLARLQT